MVNNPNIVLAVPGQNIKSTVTLQVTSNDLPVEGGGTADTAFLQGALLDRTPNPHWLTLPSGLRRSKEHLPTSSSFNTAKRCY